MNTSAVSEAFFVPNPLNLSRMSICEAQWPLAPHQISARRSAVADDRAARIVEILAHCLDLLDHGAVGEALDALMAGQAALLRRNGRIDPFGNILGITHSD